MAERITRTMMVSPSRERELKEKSGGSNIGEYQDISNEDFAGNACGIPGSFPINTIERGRSALAYAHNASDPECIRQQVYKKWPSLKPDK